jgi:AcrR family transcriptional regulator
MAARRAPANLKDRIVDSAIRLLRTSGVKSLSQPQVARAAGIPQGHLTYYFPKKRDLVMAVARRAVEQLAVEAAEFFRSGGWPGADAPMRAKVLSLLGFLVKDRARTRFLLGLVLEGEHDDKLRDLLIENAGAARQLLASGLGRQVDDAQVDLVTACLWGLALQHLLYAGNRPDEYTDQLIARMARQGGKS